MSSATLLSVRALTIEHPTKRGIVRIVDDVDFDLRVGETLGVVGESGSGKSLTMLSLVGLLPSALRVGSGTVEFEGRDLLALDEEALRKVRGGEIGFVFQDPMTSFNPVMRIGEQLAEPLRYHRGLSRAEAMGEAGRLMRVVGIPGGEARLSDYPHQLSGGMRQRVMIAMSIACQPRLLIADEPTTALDVTMQAQIVDLVAELRLRLGLAVIWISHDLALVSEVADRIMVLYSGKVIEEGPARAVCDDPRHPYTQGLLASIPTLGMAQDRRLTSIPGMPPDPARRPPGCPFAPRCGSWIARCDEAMPALEALAPGHRVACFVAGRRGASE